MRKFAIKIPPHLSCVNTLPCEMSSVLKATTENKTTIDVFMTKRRWSVPGSGVLEMWAVRRSDFVLGPPFTARVQLLIVVYNYSPIRNVDGACGSVDNLVAQTFDL